MIKLFESVNRTFQVGNNALSHKRQGFIVVETNYRVYAYTGKIHLMILMDKFYLCLKKK